MNYRRIILLIFFGNVISSLVAQDRHVTNNSFDYLRQAEPWLTSTNAAGLQHLPIQQISSVELFLNKSNGGFVNYYQSNNSLDWGARTESFFRLNPKVVLYGKVDYSNFTGKNMGGSAWIEPEYHPFNLVEMTDDNTGTKNKEDYLIVGAASVQLHNNWTIGAKLDYRAANYAKFKDLRHVNKLLDMTATAGVTYSVGTIAEIGANYIYRRSVESIGFRTYGITDRLYHNLIDFGAFYGRSELFGTGSLYAKNSSNAPMFNQFHGGALQINANLSHVWQWFNEFSYRTRAGYYGEKSPGTPVLTEHDGNVLSYESTVSWNKRTRLHQWQIGLEHDAITNNENIFQRTPAPDGGNADMRYLGQTKTLNRTIISVRLNYLLTLGENLHFPEWTLQAGAEAFERQQTASEYPYYRQQTVRNACFYAFGQKNRVIDAKNSYSVSLHVLYGSGSHSHNDGTYQTPATGQKPPATTDFNLHREYDFLTAERIQGTVGGIYYRQLNPTVRGYVRAEYRLTNALSLEYTSEKTHQLISVAIGSIF